MSWYNVETECPSVFYGIKTCDNCNYCELNINLNSYYQELNNLELEYYDLSKYFDNKELIYLIKDIIAIKHKIAILDKELDKFNSK